MGKISTTPNNSLLINDRKYKYIFTFPENNLAEQGLNI